MFWAISREKTARAQQWLSSADSVKMGSPHRLPPRTQYATQSNTVPEAFLSKALSFISAEMLSSTLKERYRWLSRLGTRPPICLRWQRRLTWSWVPPTPLTTFRTRLWLSLPFGQMLGSAAAAVVSPALQPHPCPRGTWTGAVAKAEPFRKPSGTCDRHQKGLWKGTRPFTGQCQWIAHTGYLSCERKCEASLFPPPFIVIETPQIWVRWMI